VCSSDLIEERVSPYQRLNEDVIRRIILYGMDHPELVRKAYFWDEDDIRSW